MPLPAEQSGFLGRVQQGQELSLFLQCVDAGGTPADPAAGPRASIYRDAAPPVFVETVELAADLRGVQAGVFRRALFLGGLYGTAGRHLVVLKYTDPNGAAHHDCATFVLLPGGSPDGAVISMRYVERPDASYLIWQTDAGRLVRGRNPR